MVTEKVKTIDSNMFERSIRKALRDVEEFKFATAPAKAEMRGILEGMYKELMAYKPSIEVPEWMRL